MARLCFHTHDLIPTSVTGNTGVCHINMNNTKIFKNETSNTILLTVVIAQNCRLPRDNMESHYVWNQQVKLPSSQFLSVNLIPCKYS